MIISVARELLAIAEPQPKVLNFASSGMMSNSILWYVVIYYTITICVCICICICICLYIYIYIYICIIMRHWWYTFGIVLSEILSSMKLYPREVRPHLPTKIVPAKIPWLNFPGNSLWIWELHHIRIMLESNPPRSRILVRRWAKGLELRVLLMR